MKKVLDNSVISVLRESSVITKDEIVYQFGDLFVAENVLTGKKRNIDVSGFLNEDLRNKRVLKG